MRATARELGRALRGLGRAPGFAAVVVLVLALGIGASTAIFALVDAVLLRPLPYPGADRLASVSHAAPGVDLAEVGQSVGTYLYYRGEARSFEAVAVHHAAAVNLTGEGPPERVELVIASHELFGLLGVRPLHGRLFAAEDGRPGAPTVVVLSHGLWRDRYGADPAIVGRTVRVNGRAREVIGVTPPGFAYPRPETALWMNLSPNPAEVGFADLGGLFRAGIGRLRPGVTPSRAEAELRRLVPGLAEAYADASPALLREMELRPVVRPLKRTVVGDTGAALWALFGSVGLLLLVAAANAANLFLVRAEDRRRDVAVRRALGAGSGRLAREFLAESAVVALLGGVLGLLLASLGVGVVRSGVVPDLPRLHEVGTSARVVAFAGALALLAAVSLAAVSLARHVRTRLSGALHGGDRAVSPGPGAARARRLLVAAQVALALTLLVGSALALESYRRLSAVDPGFDPSGVLVLDLALPFSAYSGFDDAAGFHTELLRRVRALPGVRAAGAVSSLPLAGTPFSELREPVEAVGTSRDGARPPVQIKLVTPGYFEALRVPVLAGRRLAPEEGAGAPPSAIVSEPLGRRLFGPGSPVSGRVRRAGAADSAWLPVSAVVGGVRHESIRGEPTGILYLPVLDRPVDAGLVPRLMSYAIRTDGAPASLVPAVQRLVSALDPELPIANARPMERIVADETSRARFSAWLLVVAAVAALVVGTVGLYGVVAYTVTRRRRELGIRLALGARASQLSRMVLREGTGLAGVGLAAGSLAALAVARLLGGTLYGIEATAPLAYVVPAVLSLGAALLASWIPARRAAGLDPARTLKEE